MNNEQEELIEKGNAAYDDRNWVEAVNYFGQASIISNNFEINKKIVDSLVHLGRFEDGVEQASIYFDKYLETNEDTKFLFELLIAAHEFLLAHQFLAVIKSHSEFVLDSEDQLLISQNLQQEENAFEHEHSEELANQAKELMSLVTMQEGVQANKIQNMKQLPIKIYLEVVPNILLNPYLHPLFKTEIIENLVKLKLEDTYSMSFYGELREFMPSKLKTLMFSPEFLQARNLLQEKLTDYDDYESGLILNEFLLYLSLTYPFTSEIITNMDEWIEVYLDMREGQTVANSGENEEIVTWINRFNQLLENFGG
ncbi:hypothetical protein Q2T76_04490 [Lactobacillus sp. YT155]|uniref:hypothetical protein n=1 Tax=Lactobacillus sp. YT155 TaxID=3060955 RepID=UPI00265DE84F|nr:hypothetical protein [Lactobacillus sp. YT155]MDO1605314.1 hypothetical protein [Lactobacillus sp. YT155]